MLIIIVTTLVIAVIGVVVGAGLVYTGKKFYVKVDEREAAVREALPGNNCGACGYAGCDAMAAAVAAGEAPVNGCPVGGAAAAEKIGAIMGVDAEAAERKVAFVRCKGSCEVTRNQGNYVGVQDCRSAVLSGLNLTDCTYGCLGLGSCVSVCPEHAIRVVDGVAMVRRDRCVGCGLCAKACPRGLIELVPESRRVAVQCSNRDRGPLVKKVCSAGCIGCGICARQCGYDAIHVADNLAHVDYEACAQCGKCVEKCPAKVITPPAQTTPAPAEQKPAAPAEEKPAAPAEEKPAAPVEEKPAAPVEEKPAAPVEEKPAAPAEEKTPAPAVEAPVEEKSAGETQIGTPPAPVEEPAAEAEMTEAEPVAEAEPAQGEPEPVKPVAARPADAEPAWKTAKIELVLEAPPKPETPKIELVLGNPDEAKPGPAEAEPGEPEPAAAEPAEEKRDIPASEDEVR